MELYRAARDGKDVAEVKAALEARHAEEAKAKLDSAMVRCCPRRGSPVGDALV